MVSYCQKIFKIWAKKVRWSYFSWYWTIMQKLTLRFQKWHEELGEISFEPSQVKSFTLMGSGFFLSKAYNVSARKFHRDYDTERSWHWKVMQNWKENWLISWKLTKGIWLIFMLAVEKLRICTLMGSFCPKHIKKCDA